MADFRPYQVPNAATRADAAIDQGLRAYMIKVYNLMAMGLVITGVAAWGTWHLAVAGNELTEFGRLIYTTPSHQYPTGAVLTAGRRLKLIEKARAHGAWGPTSRPARGPGGAGPKSRSTSVPSASCAKSPRR